MKESKSVLKPPGNGISRLFKFCWSWLQIIFSRLRPYYMYRESLKRPRTFNEPPNRSGEVVILTGGTRGIGLEILKKLLKSKFHVVIGCRSITTGEQVVSKLRFDGVVTGSTKVLELNLKCLQSVRDFASETLKQVGRIDLLINNAGVMMPPYEVTRDGYESQFQVNYLSHFLLTRNLLDKMKETGRKKGSECRVINVSSDSSFGANMDFNDLEHCKVYSASKSYADSKLCQILHARYLDNLVKEDKVRIYSLHPGVIPTDLWYRLNPCVQLILRVMGNIHFLKSKEDAANTIIYTALSPELEGVGGVYINTSEIATPHSQVEDINIQRKLWEKSLQLLEKKTRQ